jgi:ketosteroid isomerase-like protein
MSEDDLDAMRRWFDAWNSGDIDTFADLFDPNAEVITEGSVRPTGTIGTRYQAGEGA